MSVQDKLVYMAAGCGIGIVVGTLLAPQSGQEMRHRLSSKVDDFAHKVQDKVQHSRVGETASTAFHNVVERGKNVASIGKRRSNVSVDSAPRPAVNSMDINEPAEL